MPQKSIVFAAAAMLALAAALRAEFDAGQAGVAERRDRLAPTVAFLSREVPAWHAEQGCYSCHNNGDAVRALIRASAAGFDVAEPLADTVAFRRF